MAAFMEFFHAIDKDNTGVITIDDLRNYMHKKRYKAKFVTTWTKLFDPDNTGLITFEKYCEVLGLQPATAKATKPLVESDSGKQEPTDSAEIKPSTSENVEEVPIQQEFVPNVEAEKPSPDNPPESQGDAGFVGQEGEEFKDLENLESSEQTKKERADSQPDEDVLEPPRPQSRKRKHSKSPSQKDSIQVESTTITVEAQPAIPTQELGDSNVDIFDWLNTNSQQEMTFDDDDMNGKEHLVQSGIPPEEETKTEEPERTMTGEAEVESIPTAPSAEADEAPPVEHSKKEESNKRGKKTSESNKRKKKPSESSKVSEAEVVPSEENVEESVIPSLERVQLEEGPKSEEQILEPSESDGKRPASEASSRSEGKDQADVEAELNPSKTNTLGSAKSPAGKKGAGKKKREKKAFESTKPKQTHQTTDESEVTASMEQPVEVSATLKSDMQEDLAKESHQPSSMDKKQPIDIEMEISASTTEVVESAVPSFENPDLKEGSEEPLEAFMSSQEPFAVMDVPTSPKHKHKSPISKSRRKKRSSKSACSESSNSEKREGKASPKSSPDDADVEISKPRTKSLTTTLSEEFECLHIVKKHPMQIIPSPRDVPGLAVLPVEKSESPGLEKPPESKQEGMDVEQTERSDEHQPFNIEMEQTEPTSDSVEPRTAPRDRPECEDESVHIVGEHSEPIIPEPSNVQESAMPSVEKAEPCMPEKPLESEEGQMDAEVIGVQTAPPPSTEHFDEQQPPAVETEEIAPASDSVEPETAFVDRSEPVGQSMHILKRHPLHPLASPTTVPGVAEPPLEKEETCSPEKPVEFGQVGIDVEMTGVQSSSPPPTDHKEEQEPSIVEPEPTAPPPDIVTMETAPADFSESVAGSLHIVKKHPMQIIPTPTNVPESEVPSAPEEKLEGETEAAPVVEESPLVSKRKQRPSKSGKKSPNSVDKKRGKKSPKVLPTNREATATEMDPQKSPVPPTECLGDENLTPAEEREAIPPIDTKMEENQPINVEMDIAPTTAEVVDSANLSTEQQEPSGKKSPNSTDKKRNKKSPVPSKKKPREKKPSETEPREKLSPTADTVESPEPSGKKSPSSADKKRGKKSPAPFKKGRGMQSTVDVDVIQASTEGQDSPTLSAEQHEGRDSPTLKRRDKTPSESARAEEKQPSDVEMADSLSATDVIEPQNLPVEQHEPSGKISPSSSGEKDIKIPPDLSPGYEEAPSNVHVDVTLAPEDVPKSSVASSGKSEGKDKSSKKRREKKSSESAKPEGKHPDADESTAVPIATTVPEYSPENLEHEKKAGSGKKSPDSNKKRGKKTSESSSGQRKSPLTGDMEVEESLMPPVDCPDDKIETSTKKIEEEKLESGDVGTEQPIDVEIASSSNLGTTETPIPTEEHQENAKSRKKSSTSSDKKRGKKTSESSSGQRKSPLTGDMEVEESLMPPVDCPDDKIETSTKKIEVETLESGNAGTEQPIDVEIASSSNLGTAETPIPTEEHQENAKSRKKSSTSSDKKRGKKPSEPSPVTQEATPESAEAQESPMMSSEHSGSEGSASKRKRDKKSTGSTKTGEEQSSSVEVEMTSSTLESPVPPGVDLESSKSGKKSPTKKPTETTQKRKTPRAERSETSTKQKASKPQRPGASKTPKKQAGKAAEDVTTLEPPEVGTPLTTTDLPEQSKMPKLGKRRREKETKAAEEAALKESEKSAPPKDSDVTDVKKSTNKKRKTTEAPDGSNKKPSKKDEKAKKGDKNKPKKPERRKRPKEVGEGAEKSSAKKSKRPRVGHLECGRFPRSFATQVGHRVRQHRRDGAPVSTYALGKAPKGTQTKMSIGRRRRNKPNKAVRRWKLRSSLRKIGTIVILLAGRHRGKRAVIVGRHRFSGLLLVTGPFKCNGIPVRRVHPDYVIATKTRIKMGKLRLPSRMQTKEYFARQKPQPRSKNAADNLFVDANAGKKAYELKEERKEDQKLIDKRVIEVIKRSKQAKMLFAYLRSQFALSRHDMPHKMVF
ncbi:unnamed protein product [Taenia asiatica]|uniref:Large ribosomal subunit protein eL6 n=1 Tax=Taenia asiatica TaxID=60517 RepID=A0A0R3WCD0_TAEAS|nr:unnamed protein product [Taenia asiatica]